MTSGGGAASGDRGLAGGGGATCGRREEATDGSFRFPLEVEGYEMVLRGGGGSACFLGILGRRHAANGC